MHPQDFESPLRRTCNEISFSVPQSHLHRTVRFGSPLVLICGATSRSAVHIPKRSPSVTSARRAISAALRFGDGRINDIKNSRLDLITVFVFAGVAAQRYKLDPSRVQRV